MSDEKALIELLDRAHIHDAVYAFVQSLDSADWERLRSIFDDPAVVDFSSYAGVELIRTVPDWIAGLQRTFPQLTTQHIATNPTVEIEGDSAVCTVHMQAKHVRPTLRGDNWYDLGGLYIVDLKRSGSGWLITGLCHTVSWEAGNIRIMSEAAAAAEPSN
jgi:SnoaL-like domain